MTVGIFSFSARGNRREPVIPPAKGGAVFRPPPLLPSGFESGHEFIPDGHESITDDDQLADNSNNSKPDNHCDVPFDRALAAIPSGQGRARGFKFSGGCAPCGLKLVSLVREELPPEGRVASSAN
jgi:hypothetical protein